MSFKCVKGMRDFYPEDMAVRNWIMDKWRAVSLRNGFQEYDGPNLEYLDLFTAKSGEEIVEQLFSLTDRGGRQLALRPEMTPTLARMINAKAASLPRPIKWFCMPRLNRSERQQRGRLREFFQWNIDILGCDEPVADAEAIFVAIDFFREVGLTPETVVMKINSRRLITAALADLGFAQGELPPLFTLLDRRTKIAAEAYRERLTALVPDAARRIALDTLFGCRSLEDVEQLRDWSAPAREAIAELRRLFELLGTFGVGEYCAFDMSVVRGLAYYTGPVYEAYGKAGLRRAICGGGRYDDLLAALGGEPMSGTGFASSDVVIQDLLAELGLLPSFDRRTDFYVIDADSTLFDRAVALAGELRKKGFSAEFSYRRQPIGKQLKAAAGMQTAVAVIVGEETTREGLVTVKDLASGQQRRVPLADLVADPRVALKPPP